MNIMNLDRMQDNCGAGSPDYLLFNRRSYEDALYHNAHTDLDIFDVQHRSIHSDPGVHFDQQRFETLLLKNHLFKKLENSRRVAVLPCDITSRCRVRPSAGFKDAPPCQNALLQSMCQKHSTRQCLLAADRRRGLSRHRNSNKINLLPLDCLFLDQKFSSQGRALSTSLSSSATSVYSEEEFVSCRSNNLSPAPSVTSECPSVPFQSDRNSLLENETDQEWEEILKDLRLKKEQQNIENNNLAENDCASISSINLISVNSTNDIYKSKHKSENYETIPAPSAISTVLEEISSIENSDYQVSLFSATIIRVNENAILSERVGLDYGYVTKSITRLALLI